MSQMRPKQLPKNQENKDPQIPIQTTSNTNGNILGPKNSAPNVQGGYSQ